GVVVVVGMVSSGPVTAVPQRRHSVAEILDRLLQEHQGVVEHLEDIRFLLGGHGSCAPNRCESFDTSSSSDSRASIMRATSGCPCWTCLSASTASPRILVASITSGMTSSMAASVSLSILTSLVLFS